MPTLVDWQGTTVYMPDGTSSNIVKIPSTTTNINTFLAYTDHDSHCKMVLFQIARNPDTNTCSYKQLAAKYKLNTHCVREDVYCTFLEGECQTLVGEEHTQRGYGIEELTYEFPTSRTYERAPICTVAKEDVKDYPCLSSLVDPVFIPHACDGGSPCDVGLCGVDGTCTDGQLGTECNGSTDCESGYCVDAKCSDGQLGTKCYGGSDDCESGFCVNNKCSDGQVDSECVDVNDCLSENCGTESGLCEPRLVTDLGFGEVSLESSKYDCTSVDDVVPTLVDWQGTTVYMPDGTSSNIVKIPSTTTNINTFLAYTDHDSHCKMVLFQIARNPDTNTCSYKQLAAKYKLNTHCVREDVYCTFLEGECQTLVGEEHTQRGYGIEELTYEFPTSRTYERAPICTVAKEDVKDYPCLSSLVDPVFIPHACDGGSPCDVGLCGVDGTCTDGQLGTECNGGTDCESGYCVNSKCWVTDCSLHSHCLSRLCGFDGMCKSCTSGPDCNVSGSDFCVDGVCTDGKIGTVCSSGSDHCESGFCVGNICTTGDNEADCASRDDCKSGFCVNNKCSSGMNGATCSSSSDCISKYCHPDTKKCSNLPPPNPCKNNPCGPGQKCDKTSDTSYSCTCTTTFIVVLDNKGRQKCVCKEGVTKLDEDSNRCVCLAQGMLWSDQEAKCKCPSGEEWSDEDSKCVKVNPCANKTCGDNETCNPATGECSCKEKTSLIQKMIVSRLMKVIQNYVKTIPHIRLSVF